MLQPEPRNDVNAFTLAEVFTPHQICQRKFGFTLAEVLVTLGIIGVVSAMTVPSLMQNYQRQSYVTQLHKVYNETTQAALQYMTDKNALNLKEAGLVNDTAVDEWVNKYFRVVQNCSAEPSNCFAVGEYKRLNGTTLEIFNYNKNQYVLASGAGIYATSNAGNGNVNFWIDVNGKKGPNIIGRDVFPLKVYNNGVVDDALCNSTSTIHPTYDEREQSYNDYCKGGNAACWWGCFGKILNDGWQMTY